MSRGIFSLFLPAFFLKRGEKGRRGQEKCLFFSSSSSSQFSAQPNPLVQYEWDRVPCLSHHSIVFIWLSLPEWTTILRSLSPLPLSKVEQSVCLGRYIGSPGFPVWTLTHTPKIKGSSLEILSTFHGSGGETLTHNSIDNSIELSIVLRWWRWSLLTPLFDPLCDDNKWMTISCLCHLLCVPKPSRSLHCMRVPSPNEVKCLNHDHKHAMGRCCHCSVCIFTSPGGEESWWYMKWFALIIIGLKGWRAKIFFHQEAKREPPIPSHPIPYREISRYSMRRLIHPP